MQCVTIVSVFAIIACDAFTVTDGSYDITCKDEHGNAVDW